MKDIKPHFYNELTWASDLIWYDGPLLSAYTRANGETHVASWVDVIRDAAQTDVAQRWVIWKSDTAAIESARNLPIEEMRGWIRAAILGSAELLIVDVTFEKNKVLAHEYKAPADIPESYLPDAAVKAVS